ncbi:hypothetical protein ACFY3N_05020 [Streptomyces sp. NPDC000348]|uniref:hypothetical protein n=1 Tax=Streptomyces sp. NPDC000348 TaxID=3364538 RepID=UPI0036BAD831
MRKPHTGKVALIGAMASAALALPLAGSAAAETNLLPHITDSFLECQTLGNQAAQQGLLTGFSCVREGNHVIMYPW